MILAPGQPIPHGRPYHYHLNGPIHMMTARKRVGPLPAQQLAIRHSVDHSSLDYFSPDDSTRYSYSDSSSDFHSDALSDSSSLDLPSTTAGPSRKRRRSPMTSVPALPPVFGAQSSFHADLIPSPKRVRDSGYLADVEVDSRETSLRDDVIIRGSDEPHLEQDIDPEIQAEIDECFAYADALRDRGIDARVIVEAVDQVESETGARGPVEVIEGVQREQRHRIIGVESAVTALTERIAELERDNMRLRGTASVESQRVDRLQRDMSRRYGGFDFMIEKMPNTRSGASMTHEEIEELVTRRVAEEMEARKAVMNLEPLNENGDEQEGHSFGHDLNPVETLGSFDGTSDGMGLVWRNMGKTIVELHAMLKLHEKGIRKKDVAAPVVLTIRTASLCPQTKDPPPLNNEHPAKDVICHHCGEVGQWMRNSPAYLSELMKKKNKTSCASSSCIFFIELYSFPSKSWVYVTGYSTHICNTNQGLHGSRKLKIGVLNV
ncbi:hypothetical protein Tco_1206716 [Tanacetum coccineum]